MALAMLLQSVSSSTVVAEIRKKEGVQEGPQSLQFKGTRQRTPDVSAVEFL